jgi:hypothetical protein
MALRGPVPLPSEAPVVRWGSPHLGMTAKGRSFRR